MYAVIIQKLANLHSCRELRLQRRRDRDRVRCQKQPQLNSRAAQSVQEQRQLYPCIERRRDGLIADSVEYRLLEMSACQHERQAVELAEEREASLRACILQPIVGCGATQICSLLLRLAPRCCAFP